VTGFDLRKNNLAPRLGVAWDPFGTNKTAIRAGVGIFYNNVLTNAPLFAHFLGSQVSVQIINPGYPDPFTRGTTAAQPPLSTYIAAPDQPLPRAYQTTVGVQREILPGVSVGADYVNSKGRKLLRVLDTNPVTLPTFTRPDPTRGFVRVVESTGYSNYHALLLNGKGRLGSRGLVQLAYTLSDYKTTTESEAQVLQQDDLTKDDSYGYGNDDQRHRVVIGGYVTLPLQFEIGALLTARSGTPFNITVGTDINRNGTNNDRPDLAPGARVGTDDMRDRASFINPLNRPGNLPRNAGRGDGRWTLDARVGKRFTVRGWSAEALLEAFNVTNRVNFGSPVGNLAAGAAFGRPNSAADARQVQLGLRFDF
jgi:hypothetical protein